jgi:DNA-binding beta-propeller fold protein YncE
VRAPQHTAEPLSAATAPLAAATLALLSLAAAIAIAAAPASAALTHHFLTSVPSAEPRALAVEESSGDLYVAGEGAVHKFDPSEDPPTAATTYAPDPTTPVIGAGTLHHVDGIAVDQSSGDLYVADLEAVYKFSPSGELLFTNHLTADPNPRPQGLAVDPAGNLYVADNGDLEVVLKFNPAGEPDPTTPLIGSGTLVQPLGVALHAAGDVYVDDLRLIAGEQPGFYKFNPAGEPDPANPVIPFTGQFIAADPATGDLYGVSEGQGVEQFSPSGALLARISTPAGAIAIDSATGALYAADRNGGRVDVYGPAVVIPDVETSSATEIDLQAEAPTFAATLNGTVNPLGEGEASCRFAWGTSEAFGEHATCEPPGVPDESSLVAVHAKLKGLAPDTTYRYRLGATNHNGENEGEASQDREFHTPGPGIHSTSVTDVSAGSATLEAMIDPDGAPTAYRFQYLSEADFKANGESFSGPHPATEAPQPEAPLGSGKGDLEVSYRLQGLQPATAYRYRVIARSELAPGRLTEFPGEGHVFTTQGHGGALALLDNRAWELVSPPDKHGALIYPIGGSPDEGDPIQAAASGDAIAYVANAPTEAAPQGYDNGVQVLSARGPVGRWQSRDLTLPHLGATRGSVGGGNEYRSFSEDLSTAIAQPFGHFTPAISAQASEQTPFLHTNYLGADPTAFCTTSCYRPLVSGCPELGPCPQSIEEHADVAPGTVFGEFGTYESRELGTRCPPSLICGPLFVGASPDGEHVVLESGGQSGAPLAPAAEGKQGLYEWDRAAPPAQALQLISLLPAAEGGGAVPASLGRGSDTPSVRHAVSAGGSRVFFETGARLYMRDTARGETLRLDAPEAGCDACGGGSPSASFQLASADGSRVFFTDGQRLTAGSGANGAGQADLYQCEVLEAPGGEPECKLTDLTPGDRLQGGVLGASEDGSWVYFVANGVLENHGVAVPGAVPGDCNGPLAPQGRCNLYVGHDGAIALVAVISGEDYRDWSESLKSLTARVSPNGEWLAFMSDRSLTGYDNRDALSGKADEEVFLYHAGEGGRLICASCDPTGARPRGAFHSGAPGPLVDPGGVWDGRWLAANVPAWTPYDLSDAVYQSRYLSDSGRLFFNSHDALLPADSNGNWDVYEYEPPGVGGCAESSPTYAVAPQGCLDLTSSGASSQESAFLDASQSGNDAFFLTLSRLTNRDADTSYDVYDARVNGGEPEEVKPVECQGDACQPPAEAPNDPTPGSLTFHGAGNLHEEAPKEKKKKKHHKHRKAKQHHKKHKRGAK